MMLVTLTSVFFSVQNSDLSAISAMYNVSYFKHKKQIVFLVRKLHVCYFLLTQTLFDQMLI